MTSLLEKNRARLYPTVTDEQWNDWRWQMRNRLTNVDELSSVIQLSENTKDAISKTLNLLRMSITPYYLCLSDFDNPDDPILKQAIPTLNELVKHDYEDADPLHEDQHSPTPGLTHRYPDRVLFLVSGTCAMYCRHCTRRRFAGHDDCTPTRENYEKAFDYIRSHPEVRDVLLSGGDPLLLSDDTLDYLLSNLRAIEHVEVVRIGSRIPVVLPMRVTDKLCAKLADAGIPLGNQTVLLRNVNDNVEVMKKLMHGLVMMRVRPYYIYQCDLSYGLEHFRTPIGKGMEIMEALRGHTSGFCVPTFVIDAPGGGGKIPVMPNYVLNHTDKEIVLRNFEHKITRYPEPEV